MIGSRTIIYIYIVLYTIHRACTGCICQFITHTHMHISTHLHTHVYKLHILMIVLRYCIFKWPHYANVRFQRYYRVCCCCYCCCYVYMCVGNYSELQQFTAKRQPNINIPKRYIPKIKCIYEQMHTYVHTYIHTCLYT